MTNEIPIKDISESTFSISITGLANGSGRSSASITNSSDYPAALVALRIQSGGTAPTNNSSYNVYLLRDAGTVADDGWPGTDADFTVVNAPWLGSIRVTNNANTNFYGVFDTANLGPLGPTWGIAIVNNSGQALHTTESNHQKYYVYYIPEIQ